MDARAAVAVLVAVLVAVVVGLVLTVSLGVPAGAGVTARSAIDWLVVAVPVVLAAAGRPVTRA